jgi:hypothetical protein
MEPVRNDGHKWGNDIPNRLKRFGTIKALITFKIMFSSKKMFGWLIFHDID